MVAQTTDYYEYDQEDDDYQTYEQEEEIILTREEKNEEDDFTAAVDSVPSRKRKGREPLTDEETKAKKMRELQRKKEANDLVAAARSGAWKDVQSLIEQGAPVNECVCGYTALMYSAFYGHCEMTQSLLKLGANINEVNLSGHTSLMMAVERNHVAVVEILVEAKADVNKVDNKGLSALHKAIRSGSLQSVQLLVNGSADVNMEAGKESENCTPLQEAAFSGNKDIVEYLLEHDASVDQRNSQGGKTALFRAVYKNHADIARILLDCGADINAQDSTGRTALHWAVFCGDTHLETVKVLVEYGADLTMQDKAKQTAQTIAVNKKHRMISEFFSHQQQF